VQFRSLFIQRSSVPSFTEILEKILFQYIDMWIWFSLLWPFPTPGDHDLNKLESKSYQKAFIKLWRSLAQWFLRRFLNESRCVPHMIEIDPIPFLHFCDYLHLETDCLIDCLRFYVSDEFLLVWRRHQYRWRAAIFKSMLGAWGLWAGRNLYCAPLAVTWDMGRRVFRFHPKNRSS
jgi:hypothetical protein